MRPRTCIVLLVCLGLSVAVPPSSSGESTSTSGSSPKKPLHPHPHPQDNSKVLMKRDFKGPEADHHLDSYAAPVADSYAAPHAESYAAPPPQGDNGYYYYYHPVEEEGSYKYGGYGDGKECGMGKALLAPLILIDIFVGILAAEAIGLIPKFELPPIQIPALPALPGLPGFDLANLANLGLVKPELIDLNKPDLLGLNKPNILGKSSNDENYTLTDYVPWGVIGKLTTVMSDAMEKDECSARLVCETGKYAEGYEMMLGVMEVFAPLVYQNKIKIFKDSALKKSNCKIYRCGYVDGNEL